MSPQYIQYCLAIQYLSLAYRSGGGFFLLAQNVSTCLRCGYRRGGGRQQPLSNSYLMTTSTLVSCSLYISKPPPHPEDPIENNVYFLLPTHKIIDLKCKYYKLIQV
jgi:hypothetical protein